jgi:hypothetical protein
MAESRGENRNRVRKRTKAEHSEWFKEIAWKLGVDETGEAFERVLRRIVPIKRHKGSG